MARRGPRKSKTGSDEPFNVGQINRQSQSTGGRGDTDNPTRILVSSNSVFSGIPQPAKFMGITEGVYTTDTYENRLLTSLPEAYCIGATSFGLSKTTGMGVGTATDTGMTTIGNFLSSLYGAMVRTYKARTGITLRDTVLDEPAGFQPAGSLPTWLNFYGFARLHSHTLLALLSSAEFNNTTRLISAAIMRAEDRLRNALVQLYTYAVPPQFGACLDYWAGPVAMDITGPLIFLGTVNVAPALADYTTDAGIAAVLTAIEGSLAQLSAISGGSQDTTRIANTLAACFPSGNKPYVRMGVAYDPLKYMALTTQLIQFRNITSTNRHSAPNINFTTDVPLWIPAGPVDMVGLKYHLSYMGPPKATNDPTAGVVPANVPTQFGLWQNTSGNTQGSCIASYSQAGVITQLTTNIAFPASIQMNDSRAEFYWFSDAGQASTSYINDARELQRAWQLGMAHSKLINETTTWWTRMFIGDIISKSSSR